MRSNASKRIRTLLGRIDRVSQRGCKGSGSKGMTGACEINVEGAMRSFNLTPYFASRLWLLKVCQSWGYIGHRGYVRRR